MIKIENVEVFEIFDRNTSKATYDWNLGAEDIKKYISEQEKPDIQLTSEQEKAIDYAHRYCGVSTENEHELKFNKNYTAILRSSSILFLEVGIIPQLGVE